MAHFRATIQGSRGEASRLGGMSSGITARVNGWSGGVRVEAAHEGDEDHFRIFATKGSGHGNADGYIGEVVEGRFILGAGETGVPQSIETLYHKWKNGEISADTLFIAADSIPALRRM
jgi:hypothetical protein